jgi:hypothetical protein
MNVAAIALDRRGDMRPALVTTEHSSVRDGIPVILQEPGLVGYEDIVSLQLIDDFNRLGEGISNNTLAAIVRSLVRFGITVSR